MVLFFPFKLTEKKPAQYRNSQWFLFWQNLKTGFDLFEGSHQPPNVNVKNKKYRFD